MNEGRSGKEDGRARSIKLSVHPPSSIQLRHQSEKNLLRPTIPQVIIYMRGYDVMAAKNCHLGTNTTHRSSACRAAKEFGTPGQIAWSGKRSVNGVCGRLMTMANTSGIAKKGPAHGCPVDKPRPRDLRRSPRLISRQWSCLQE